MTTHRPTSTVDVILTAGEPHPSGRPDPNVPFRMLIMGDFSGKGTMDRAEQRSPANWRPIRVDRDNIQDLTGKFDVSLHSPLLGDSAPSITLKCAELDDFHPDRLVHQVEPLRKLLDLRQRLANQATFAQAATRSAHGRNLDRPPKPNRLVPSLYPTRQTSVTHQPAVCSTN